MTTRWILRTWTMGNTTERIKGPLDCAVAFRAFRREHDAEIEALAVDMWAINAQCRPGHWKDLPPEKREALKIYMAELLFDEHNRGLILRVLRAKPEGDLGDEKEG